MTKGLSRESKELATLSRFATRTADDRKLRMAPRGDSA